jgi:hypothetical protein
VCLLCIFVYCFEVQIVEMAKGSAASSSDSVGVRRSQKVSNRCTKLIDLVSRKKKSWAERHRWILLLDSYLSILVLSVYVILRYGIYVTYEQNIKYFNQLAVVGHNV